MKKVSAAFKAVLADLVKLQNPTLAASAVSFVIATVAPFGLDLGPNGGKILAVVAAVAGVAALLEKLFVKKSTK